MKTLPICIALTFGLLVGWFAGHPSINPPSLAKKDIPEKPQRPQRTVRVSPVQRIMSAPEGPPFHQDTKKRIEGFRVWIAQMEPSNWGEYLDFAVSEEAMNHEFLSTKTIESLEFLHKLGETAGSEPIRFLLSKNLTMAAAEVMEGWANVAPEEAFAWITDPARDGELGDDQEIFAKAAGAMMDIDFDAVWKHIYQIREPMARELVRRNGFQEADQKLLKYWTQPGGDLQYNQHLQNLYQDWEGVVIEHLKRQAPDPSDQLSFSRKALAERYVEYLEMDLNPGIREWAEYQLQSLDQGSTRAQ